MPQDIAFLEMDFVIIEKGLVFLKTDAEIGLLTLLFLKRTLPIVNWTFLMTVLTL